MYFFPVLLMWNLNFSKQLSYAPLGQNGCSTANAPTESNIAESSEPFRTGVQFTSSLLLSLTQAQPVTSIRIWQYALCFTFGQAQCSLFDCGVSYATGHSITSSQSRQFAIFLQFIIFAVVVSERTTTCYVGSHG